MVSCYNTSRVPQQERFVSNKILGLCCAEYSPSALDCLRLQKFGPFSPPNAPSGEAGEELMAILCSLINLFSRVCRMPGVQGNRGNGAGQRSLGCLQCPARCGRPRTKQRNQWKLPVVQLILATAPSPLTTQIQTMVSFKSRSLHRHTDTTTIEEDT